MDRSGFKAKGFFVMDGSKRSAHSNAFFTGHWQQQKSGLFRHLA
jgi:STE24 endopeptidase